MSQLDRLFIGDGEYVRADEAVQQVTSLQAEVASLTVELNGLKAWAPIWANDGKVWRERAEASEAECEALRAELAWYGEQARLARLIHSEGDAGRHALAADGGKRARAILNPEAK